MLSNDSSTTVAANLVRNSPHRVSPSPPLQHPSDKTINGLGGDSSSSKSNLYNETFSAAVRDNPKNP